MYDDLKLIQAKPNLNILQKPHQFWKTPKFLKKSQNLG